ncbi:MAG: phosphodiester glycosidase family protein [Verrucomicrobiota bacterium]
MTAKKHVGWRHGAISRATRFDGTIAMAISRLVFSALLLVGHGDTLAESGTAALTGSHTNLAALKPSGSADHGRISGWKPIFLGVEMCEGSSRIPRPLQVRAVRVDLKQPTVDFLVTPRLADGRGVFGARKTSEFLSEFRCQVAINASVFDVLAKKRGDPMRVEDLSLSRGDLYLSSNKWDALLISTNNRAWIARAPVDAAGAYNGCSGFYALLIQGQNNGGMKNLHPRSAVGISRNGRYLILMAIDGRQPRYSEGATTAETAEWMRKLGAYDALNLDGGGSTALVIEGEDGAPLAVNRPCGSPVGTERRVANHLGVYARKLPPAKLQLN